MLLIVTEYTLIIKKKMFYSRIRVNPRLHPSVILEHYPLGARPGPDSEPAKYGQFLWWLTVHKSGRIIDQQDRFSRPKINLPRILSISSHKIKVYG